MKEIVIEVEGMKCGMCEAHVSDAVRKAAKVGKVVSSHKKGQTAVICEDGTEAEPIVAAIAALGYGVGAVTERPYEKRGLFRRG